MKLIGMLDSPYVRRTAISLDRLGIAFEHHAVSVFSTVEQFRALNPVIKAPTLICDDGLLMDSTLIIDYAEALAAPQSLMPAAIPERLLTLRVISYALAACEKAVQIVYERNLRPAEKRHDPWLTRVQSQLLAACEGLEHAIQKLPTLAPDRALAQSYITAAVAWQFIQSMVGDQVPEATCPHLAKLSTAAEAREEFLRYPPDGPGVQISA